MTEPPDIHLDAELLHETGLIWKINHDLLHPLGIALAYEPGDDYRPSDPQLYLSIKISRDGRWEFGPGIDEELGQHFDDWYETRIKPLFDA